MTKEEAIADLKEALKETDMFRKIYFKQRKVSVEYEKRYASLSFAINELEQQPITWIVGKDNCQVAVRNMPIDKMQKICAIIEEEELQPKTIQEKQAESEKYQKAFDDGYENGYAQARFDYGQQPCEDCVKRKDVKSGMIKYGFLAPDMTVTEFVEQLPPVTPTSDAFDKIINKIEQTRDKDKIAEYPYNRCIRIIEEYKGESEVEE